MDLCGGELTETDLDLLNLEFWPQADFKLEDFKLEDMQQGGNRQQAPTSAWQQMVGLDLSQQQQQQQAQGAINLAMLQSLLPRAGIYQQAVSLPAPAGGDLGQVRGPPVRPLLGGGAGPPTGLFL